MKKYSFDLIETGDEDYPFKVNGVSYQGMPEVLMRDFGFCDCGNPEAALDFIYNGLKIWQNDDLSWEDKDASFPDISSMWFFLYWANKEEILEHGGSVYGSWLTEKGIDFVNDYELWKENEAKLED